MGEVEKLLRLPRGTIRSLIAAGFVCPARGARNEFRFSFQDLIVLRTARALVEAQVPARRITRSIRELRRHLPDAMPLSGLSIGAVADRVVVREGATRWQADSGQYLLAFEGDPAEGSFKVVEPKPATAGEWFDRAVALEPIDPGRAMQAYDQALAAEPANVDIHINRSRLLHEIGRLREAQKAYLDAIDTCGAEAVLLFNLGVLLEDMSRRRDAIAAYEGALRVDPGFADAHYNLALLLEQLGRGKEALRHMADYRRLVQFAP